MSVYGQKEKIIFCKESNINDKANIYREEKGTIIFVLSIGLSLLIFRKQYLVSKKSVKDRASLFLSIAVSVVASFMAFYGKITFFGGNPFSKNDP